MGLLILWGGIIFDIQRSQAYQYHFGQTSIQLQAQTFAESTRSNLDRINAFLSNIRSDYLEKQSRFGEQVSHRQEFVSDLVDELMVIDVNGNRVFSNIHSKSEPIYLGDKDFFKSHIGRGVDSLFISQANLNPLTHHWGLQFSRPIFNGNLFKGVIVASVSSDSLSNFNDKISLSNSVVTTISKSSGSILSRSVSNDEIYRLQLKGFPFNNPNGPVKGVYQRVSQSDQTNRLFAYVRLPEFDLIVFASQPVQEVMAPFEEHRIELLTTGTLLSLFLIGIGLLVMRNQKQSERVEQKARESEAMLLAAIEATGEGFVIFDQQDRLVFLNER